MKEWMDCSLKNSQKNKMHTKPAGNLKLKGYSKQLFDLVISVQHETLINTRQILNTVQTGNECLKT